MPRVLAAIVIRVVTKEYTKRSGAFRHNRHRDARQDTFASGGFHASESRRYQRFEQRLDLRG
ncbi:hypothetical protein OKW46_002235 [Paraburkholderia sp. WSM4179]|nr:hypothetical protein [Paraburkholderia sp. WSM4179]